MRLVCGIFVGLGLALPAAASADSGSISLDGSSRLANVAYSVTADTCPAQGTCGWYGFATAVDPSVACDPNSTIVWAGSYTEAPASQTDSTPLFESGQRRICLWIKHNQTGPSLLADQVVGDAPRQAVDHTDAIPSDLGQQGGGLAIRVSLRGLPAGVSQSRFVEIVRRSAARWGLTVAGTTKRRPALQRSRADGMSVIGFSRGVDSNTLGQESLFTSGSRLLDDDIALNARKSWQEGPEYPSNTQVDLETVVIHELGHFAGNNAHADTCDDSPMVESFRAGDWWRAPDDWSRASCG